MDELDEIREGKVSGQIIKMVSEHVHHENNLIVKVLFSFPSTDSKEENTGLYWTQRGGFFLAGQGGALSQWAKKTPQGAVPGEGIEPLSKAEALDYANYAGLPRDHYARAGLEPMEGYS